MSAVIVPAARDKEVKFIADEIRTALGMQPREVIHFAHLKHDRRVHIINKIAKTDWLTLASVLINKERIEHPEIFSAEKFRLYKYAARLLLELISWYCRDKAAPSQECECKLIFEHRKHMSYDDLRAYLNLLKTQSQEDAWIEMLLHDVRIHWPAIVPENVGAAQKAQYAGLQLADCAASGKRAALEYRHGHTEHRYAKMLKPRIYKRGNYSSYGLKFFPRTLAATDERGHWLRKHYR